MKKIVIHKAGGYDQLKIESSADLLPQKNEVVVDVKAIGVNYADCCVRWGVYESAKQLVGWPITPGFEFSGVVRTVGPDCKNIRVGQEVMGITLFNAYATQVKVPESQIFLIPKNFSFEQAAGFPAVFITAYHALFQLVKIYPNSKVLIHSAAGGVGSALVQQAKLAGLHVTGVIGSTHKTEYLKSLGADCIIDKSKQDLWAEAEKIAPGGFDAIFDANGYTTFQDSYAHLRPVGKLITYGSHSLLPKGGTGHINYFKAALGLLKTPKYSPLKLITDNKSVIGFNLSFLFDRNELATEALKQLGLWAEQGLIKPPKITAFAFGQVSEAHKAIESGQSIGKIILTV